MGSKGVVSRVPRLSVCEATSPASPARVERAISGCLLSLYYLDHAERASRPIIGSCTDSRRSPM
jgi:hypothetical protein